MKVTIVVGGRWHAFDLAKELNKHGHLHRIITSYPRWFVMQWEIPREKIISLPLTFWIVKAIYKFGGEALMMRCQQWVHHWFAHKAVEHLEGSDLIHGWSQWSEPSLRWAKNRGIPTILERSSAHILEQTRLLRDEHARHGIKWTSTHAGVQQMELNEYELCSQIAIPSLFVERSFLARGFNQTRLIRNPFGVDLVLFRPPKEPPQPPVEYGLQVVYAGSLSVRKGIGDLLSGFEIADLNNAKLTLIGGVTPEIAPLLDMRKANILQVGHRPQNELAGYYRRAHCFVIASVEEGMAMVQMQALASGLPIVCTKNSGGEDLLRLDGEEPQNGKNGVEIFKAGYVVPIHSPEAIAWCLRQLAKVPGEWERKREAALCLAKRELSWSAYGERAVESYKRLLGKQK